MNNNLLKGFITTIETQRTFSFMFNPVPVQESVSWNFEEQAIPGRSHPHLYGGAGSGETLSFTLPLDGSRGLLEVTSYPDGSEIPESRNLNVYLWIHELLAMVVPADPQGTGAHGTPNKLYINIPGLYNGEGRLSQLDIAGQEWYAGVLFRASVGVTFKGVRRSNLTNTLMLRGLSNDPLLPIVF